jgi:peptidoglycan/LPS O-acetylase OafA/YrhL/lysophospholipase L1-like esterase
LNGLLPTRHSGALRAGALPYVAGLDGLRAIAVVAVLLYHARDISGLPDVLRPASGFLGVEVFFVLSGYLITALLVAEYERRGSISLGGFWLRRGRRLLPALYVLLGAVAAMGLVSAEVRAALRSELLAALFYVSNWLQIAQDTSYFDSLGRPSLLQHLWSLAVEEQFYLVWPLVMFAGLRWLGRRRLLGLTLVGVVASTGLAWWLFDRLEPYGDVTGIYYRTDARAAGLLVGAALALMWRPWLDVRWRDGAPARWRWGIDALGLLALAVVIGAQYGFTDQVAEWGLNQRLYHGGFLLTSVPTAVLIAALVVPGSALGRNLGGPVLRWAGTRSYALYLWHWPVFQLTRPRLDLEVDGWALLALRLAITVVLAELSYRLVEQPIRERRFGRELDRAREWATRERVAVAGANAGAVLSVAVVALWATAQIGGGVSGDAPGASAARVVESPLGVELAASLDAAPPVDVLPRGAETTTAPSIEPSPPTRVSPVQGPASAWASAGADRPSPQPAIVEEYRPPVSAVSSVSTDVEEAPTAVATEVAAAEPTAVATPSEPRKVARTMTVVGDSVVLGASSELVKLADGVTISAQVGRQWYEVTKVLEELLAAGPLGDVVVIQLGNNGTLTPELFDAVMGELADVETVVFVNVRVPRSWEADVNALIADGVARHAPQARLADWHAVSNDHDEYFLDDGVHLQAPGREALRELVEETVAGPADAAKSAGESGSAQPSGAGD